MSQRPHAVAGIVIGFCLVAVWFTGQFPPFANPNELSRLEAVYAVVEQGTFAIDGAVAILGDHEDKAVAGGHVYSNKAPGLTLAAIPVYRVLRVFWPAPRTAGAPIFILLRLLVVSSVCAAALARFCARLSDTRANAPVALAIAFGTPFLFYARSFFSHAWTAALLFLSWDLIRRAEEREHSRRVFGTILAAGILAMWAAISEYPVGPIVALLALRAFAGRSWRRVIGFLAGAVIPAALLLVYNTVCFGSPFVLSSAREASSLYAGLANQGLFGMGRPSLSIAERYLWDPARGLLLFSPFWIWAIPGFWRWLRSGHDRADSRLALAVCVVYFVLMTGYANWHGGWSLGNRYLLPVLFFAGLSLPHALAAPLSRALFFAAATFSVAVHFLLTVSWPHFPPDFSWPVAAGSRWFLERGWAAPNVLSTSVVSLLVPAAITAAAAALVLRNEQFGTLRPVLAAVFGLLLAVAFAFVGREPAYGPRLWRAAIYGAYSGRDPGREELKRVVLSASTPAERRQAASAWRLYGPRD